MPYLTKENSYTPAEFAVVLGISLSLFAVLKKTHPDFPMPIARTSRGYCYDKAEAEAFAIQFAEENAKREAHRLSMKAGKAKGAKA